MSITVKGVKLAHYHKQPIISIIHEVMNGQETTSVDLTGPTRDELYIYLNECRNYLQERPLTFESFKAIVEPQMPPNEAVDWDLLELTWRDVAACPFAAIYVSRKGEYGTAYMVVHISRLEMIIQEIKDKECEYTANYLTESEADTFSDCNFNRYDSIIDLFWKEWSL